MTNEQLIQRLDLLAARLEDEGRYVDALLVTFAIERLGGDATNWARIMDGLWKQQKAS